MKHPLIGIGWVEGDQASSPAWVTIAPKALMTSAFKDSVLQGTTRHSMQQKQHLQHFCYLKAFHILPGEVKGNQLKPVDAQTPSRRLQKTT